MRVLVDAFWWVGGPVSGRVVLHEMVQAWREEFPDDELVLAVPRQDRSAVSAAVPGVEVVGLRARPHAVAAALELPRVARRHRVDVTIAQNYTPVRGRAGVFIHDVLYWTNPEWFTAAERLYFSPMTPLARRAACVLTSSATEAARIERVAPRLAPVAPVGLAVASSLLEATPTVPTALDAGTPFLLSVCRLNVRKNLVTAIEAAVRAENVTPQCPLVVVGEVEGRAAQDSPVVTRALESGLLRIIPRVTDGELRWLYEHARLLVFLSLGEGFGLPPVEALAFGCPVLASDLPIFRETLGSAGQFCPPLDVEAAAAVMDRAAAGLLRRTTEPRPYSWAATVRAMRDALAPVGAPRPTVVDSRA